MFVTGSRRVEIRTLVLAAMLLLASFLAHEARAQDSSGCSFTLGQPQRSRGDPFTLTLARSPTDAATATVTLSRVANGATFQAEHATYVPAKDAVAATVSGAIGAATALGDYQVGVIIGDTPCYPSDNAAVLSVVPRGDAALRLDPFDPAYIDHVSKSRTTRLILRGHGFQSTLADNVVYINSVEQQLTAGDCAAAKADDKPVARQVLAQVVSTEEIDLCRVPVPASGILRVQVSVADKPSGQQIFQVYPYGKTRVAIEAGIVALLLAFLPLVLLGWMHGSYTIAKQQYRLRLLFLDPQTDSYSLSKLQFYLWTVAALFSYAYLFISHVMIQKTVWPDVPPNLPGVIAIAAGTTVSSLLVTSAKGSIGAGSVEPNFADFITSGGVVAPDRVQMLLWTLFGVGAFVVSTLKQSPVEISSLPTVPDNFMYLMGLSSAGYLGGKLARKAGPVINEISISPTDPDDAILAAASSTAEIPDFTDAYSAAQVALQHCGTSTNAHAQAAVKALSDALSATRAAANTAEFGHLFEMLGQSQSAVETEAAAIAEDFSTQPSLAPDAAIAQTAAAAVQEFRAGVTQAIAQTAGFHLREALEIPRIARIITLRGSNLSAEALLQIDHADLPFRMLLDSDGKQMPRIVTREDATPSFARVLELTIDPSNLGDSDLKQFHTWFGTKGSHTLTLTNPDGQMAEAEFPLPPGESQKSGTT